MYNYIFNLKKNKINEFMTDPIPDIQTSSTSVVGESSRPGIDIKKKFEDNKNINNSMLRNSLSKIVSNVVNNVSQNNVANIISSIGASNTFFASNIKCDDFVIGDINQRTQAMSKTTSKVIQESTNKISNDIQNSINETMNKISEIDLSAYNTDTDSKLKEFLKSAPGLRPPKCSSSVFGSAKCSSPNYTLDEDYKSMFNLDNSFTINTNDNLSTDINNIVSQTNESTCAAIAISSNVALFQDIKCKKFDIGQVEQEALVNLYKDCLTEQMNKNDTSTKIVNMIARKYDEIYRAIGDRSEQLGPEYYRQMTDYLDLVAAADMDKLNAVAGNLDLKNDSNNNNKESSDKKVDSGSRDNKYKNNKDDSGPKESITKHKYDNTIRIVGVVSCIILIFAAIGFFAFKKKDD